MNLKNHHEDFSSSLRWTRNDSRMKGEKGRSGDSANFFIKIVLIFESPLLPPTT
ncbi:MAG TPA: hypothetical protein VMV47_04350 [Bacteroidales bacterium]|nr:hypothetical protein [Bacteroidales bacterium]